MNPINSATGVETLKLVIDATSLKRETALVNKHLDSISKTSKKTSDSLSRMMNIGRAVFFISLAKSAASFTVELALSAEKLDLLSKKMTTLTNDVDALDKMVAAANRVGVEFTDLGSVVSRFAVATRGAFSTDEMLSWTEGIVMSGRLIGSTQKEISSGMVQLSQALSSNRLGGDEFRSIMENLPMLAIEMRKQFEGDTRALKDLAAQGMLTGEVMVEAMQSLNDSIQGLPGLTDTVGSDLARLGNSWDTMLNKMLGSTDNWIRSTIKNVTWMLDEIGEYFKDENYTPENIAKRELANMKSEVASYEDALKGLQGTLGTIAQAGIATYGTQENLESALNAVGKQAKDYQKKIDELTESINNWNGRTKEQQDLQAISDFKKQERDLTEIAKVNKDLINLSEKANLAGEKSLRIAAKWEKYRDKILESMMDERQGSKALTVANQALENSYAAEAAEIAKLTPVKKGLTDAQKLENELAKERQALYESAYPLAAQWIEQMVEAVRMKDLLLITDDELIAKQKELTLAYTENVQCESIKRQLTCMEELIHKYSPLKKAEYEREESLKRIKLVQDKLTDKEFSDGLATIEKTFKDATTATKEAAKELSDYEKMMGEFFEGVEKNTVGFVADFLKGEEDAFENFTDRLLDMWIDMIAEMAVKSMMGNFSFNMAGAAGGNLSGTQAGASGGASFSSTDLASVGKKIWDGFMGGAVDPNFVGPMNQGVTGTYGAGVSNPMVGGGASLLGGYVAGQVGGWGGVAAGGLAGVGGVAAAGALGIGTAGAAAGGGMAGASAALSAMGPVGWAALAASVLYSSGVFDSQGDVTPDLNVSGGYGGDGKGAYTVGLGGEGNGTYDPGFGYSGTLGRMYVSTQHDAFSSEEAAQDFINGVNAEFKNMDDSIIKALGAGMTETVVSAMGNINFSEFKAEEGDEWGNALEQHYKKVFGTAMSAAAEVTEDENWNIWKSLTGDMSAIVQATVLYVTATDEVRGLYDEMISLRGRDAAMLVEQMGNWVAVNGVMEMLGVSTYEISVSGVDAANALVEAAGGLMNLAELTGYFFTTFYSAQEQGAHYTKIYAETIDDLNKKYDIGISTSTSAYKVSTQAILDNADASAELKVEMLALAPVAAQVIQAQQAAAAEQQAIADAAQQAADALAALRKSLFEFALDAQRMIMDLEGAGSLEKLNFEMDIYLNQLGLSRDKMTLTNQGYADFLKTLDYTNPVILEMKDSLFGLGNVIMSITDISNNAVNTIKQLNQLGMTDSEISTQNSNNLFNKVDDFGLGFSLDDIGVSSFIQSMISLTGSFEDWGVSAKDLGFTADMTSDEIIAFTNALIDSGVNLDESAAAILEWAADVKESEDNLIAAQEAAFEFSKSMKELYYSLKGESDLDNTIRQIREVLDEFGYVGSHASLTSDQLADFVITLDGMDDVTLNAEGSITKLANAMINLDAIIASTQSTIDSILSDQRMQVIDDAIAAEQRKLNLAQQTSTVESDRYENAIRSNEIINNFLSSLLISDLKNQSPYEQMMEASKLFSDAVAEGNAEDATGFGREYLEFAQKYYASSGAYTDIYDKVTESLTDMIVNPGVKPVEIATSTGGGSSALSVLEAEKAALMNEMNQAALHDQNIELITALNDMALAKDASLFDVMDSFDVSIDNLGWDLIGTLKTLNDATVVALIDYTIAHELSSTAMAEKMDMNYITWLGHLTDQGLLLKDIVAWDKIIADGTVLTAKSILDLAVAMNWDTETLADKYGASETDVINYLVSIGFTLDQIETWNAKVSNNTANTVTNLKGLTDAMIVATRTEEQSSSALGYGGVYTQNELLHYIGEQTYLTASGISKLNSGLGIYEQGTNYVPNDQLAYIHKGEAVVPAKYNGLTENAINNDEDVITELRELRKEMVQLREVNREHANQSIAQQKRIADQAEESNDRERML